MRKHITRNMIDDIAESLDWKVNWYEDCVEFNKYSPAGEDYGFTVWYKHLIDIPEGVQEAHSSFDATEHVKLWIDSCGRNGVPELKELVQDADAICSMIGELADALCGE